MPHLQPLRRIPRTLRLLRGAVLLAALGLSATLGASREGVAIVEVNRASVAQLDGLKGIGPALSSRILNAREASGPFQDWADLRHRVKGLGRHTAAQLSRQGLRVNGADFDDHQASGAAGPDSGSAQH